uniref:NADH-ubiquinone oxidoreductase chain 2 n=1 Tax=Caprella scaura TaxID=703580 RepID=E2RVN6_9CRUS|nr:NADH dehydrogenase subunit 2 [Caprella scaura]BAJ23210.1 NADH dehydrogenase subunit 2 [Caprella scaura]
MCYLHQNKKFFYTPQVYFFFVLLILTVIMILSAESWLMVWLFLEINLLLFIPMMFSKKSKYQSEASLKYFINQAMSSVMILSAITFLPHVSYLVDMALCAAFSLKMGVAPLHGWLISVSSSLSWFSLWLLLILQKVGPMLVMNTLVNFGTFMMLYVFVTSTAVMGAVGGLSTPSMKKIMAYSSIAQMGWLLMALISSSELWVMYFMIYSSVTSVILLSLYFTKSTKLNDLLTNKNKLMKIMMSINMLAIAGLPPFSGFIMKMTLIMQILETNKMFILFPLITSSLVSLFFYSRIFYMNIINYSGLKMKMNKPFLEKWLICANTLALPVGGLALL